MVDIYVDIYMDIVIDCRWTVVLFHNSYHKNKGADAETERKSFGYFKEASCQGEDYQRRVRQDKKDLESRKRIANCSKREILDEF